MANMNSPLALLLALGAAQVGAPGLPMASSEPKLTYGSLADLSRDIASKPAEMQSGAVSVAQWFSCFYGYWRRC